ncbi:MAG: hypothetical protein AVDCRST_MAG66-2769, partial [uncultured Pseudonocardia sp.]
CRRVAAPRRPFRRTRCAERHCCRCSDGSYAICTCVGG